MKITNNNKGFTLIELIMVIVILGILAAVVVPKFFDFTAKAHEANEKAVIGAIRAGLNLYAVDELVKNGARKFPGGDVMETAGNFSAILDEEPNGWDVTSPGTGGDDKVEFVYNATEPDTKYEYESPYGGDDDKYNLKRTAGPSY